MLLVDHRGGCSGSHNSHSWEWCPVLIRCFFLYFSLSSVFLILTYSKSYLLCHVMIFLLLSKSFCLPLALPRFYTSSFLILAVFSPLPQTICLISLLLLIPQAKYIVSVFPRLPVCLHLLSPFAQLFMLSFINLNKFFFLFPTSFSSSLELLGTQYECHYRYDKAIHLLYLQPCEGLLLFL